MTSQEANCAPRADMGEKPGVEKIAQKVPFLFGENYIGGFVGPPLYEPDNDCHVYNDNHEYDDDDNPRPATSNYPAGECYGIQAFAKTSNTMWALCPYLARYAHVYGLFAFAYDRHTRISDVKRKIHEFETKEYETAKRWRPSAPHTAVPVPTDLARMRIETRDEFADNIVVGMLLADDVHVQNSCVRSSRGVLLFNYYTD